jgi:hypothetical protein
MAGFPPISHILATGARSEVVSLIVEAIAISVVYVFVRMAYLSVHKSRLAFAVCRLPTQCVFGIVPCGDHYVPFPFREALVIFWAYFCKSSLRKGNKAVFLRCWAGFLFEQVHGRLSKDVRLRPILT